MLKVSEVTKKWNDQTILHCLSFSVKQGERVALTAPSGTGKTTLISILAGIDKEFSGTVALKCKKRGVVFQEPGLFWYKTVGQNILYPLELEKLPLDRQIQERYRLWLCVTGLGKYEDHYPHEISRGMKQKTALVRALILNPDFLLMDEPFSAMDKASVTSIVNHIHSSCPGITLVAASHTLEGSLDFFDKVLVAEKTPITKFEI
ncbi:SsuB [Desulforapulum autotrophicum HRM2]|uniref:SsuB n=1 Tax=Desulforapulum autotrophicum (strain ATCC 43914 / DSM 3382 / VKM B-1955 / HRM2) TaxID=177437 RepID=C0QI13_DESAH|nr:ATP-binding cassette domain-containing protein [Desulforapulum autotrophicum]ACN15749.1 SsuB [Desulforapulum autotrophicum HRM2]